MRILLLLPLLLMQAPTSQTPQTRKEGVPVLVNSFRVVKDRKPPEAAVGVTVAPVRAVIDANKNLARDRRTNSPAGERDPNADTLDGRGAELERIVQESREPQPIDGFTYSMKVQNGSGKVVQILFWEYQFREVANPANVTRRQFLCSARINPDKAKELQVFTLLGPSNVVSIKSLAKRSANQFEEGVLINRVEFADGTFWQRTGWDVDELKLIPKARSETRNMPVCRSL
jgi:hypothetical protein